MIDTLLVKTTAAVAANTPTTDYKIYAGTLGSEADAGFTAVPSAVSRVALGNNTWALLHRVNNGWELGAHTSGTLWFKGQLAQTISSSSSTPVNVDGLVSVTAGVTAPVGTVSANNTMGWVGTNNDPCWVIQNTAVDPVQYELMNVKWDEKPRVKDTFWDGPSASLKQTVQDIITKEVVSSEIDELVLAALTHTFLDSMSCSGLQNSWTYETIQYLGQSVGPGSGNCTHTVPPPVLTPAIALDNVWISGTSILGSYKTLLVHAASASIPFVIHVGTACFEETSGMGAGVAAQTEAAPGDMTAYNAQTAINNFNHYY